MRSIPYSSFLAFILCVLLQNSLAQTNRTLIPVVHASGDTARFRLGEFRGAIQWQQSADLLSWVDIPGGNQDSLALPVTGPLFIRAQVTEGSCAPLFSDTMEIRLLPLVSTGTFSAITGFSALGGGEVLSEGSSSVTERGICWVPVFSSSGPPTVSDSHNTAGQGIGPFPCVADGLSADTYYYFRAYATNAEGTAYGAQVLYQTPSACTGVNPAVDFDLNSYPVIGIGNQCWTQRNMAAKHYADGTALVDGLNAGDLGTTTTQKYWFYYNNNPGSMAAYGLFYTWAAVMNGEPGTNSNPGTVRGICPLGWHVPTDSEWTEMEIHEGMPALYADSMGYRGPDHGARLKESGYAHWYMPNTGATNLSGFTGLPGGIRDNDGTFDNVGYFGLFWTASLYFENFSMYRRLSYINTYVERNNTYNSHGFSVRCLHDPIVVPPLVHTLPVTGITFTGALAAGDVIFDGGSSVTMRGVCWNTTGMPVYTDAHLNLGPGTGSFSGLIGGLAAATTYYLRAFAVNSTGVSYGEEIPFTTLPPVPPVVSTGGVTVLTFTTAQGGGEVLNDGGSPVTARGLCWSTSPLPLASGDHSNDGTGMGPFTGSLTGLTANTAYFVRAYATNALGTAYGAVVTFSTSLTLPVVTTDSVTLVAATFATGHGTVVSQGGTVVTARGLCWNTTGAPDLSGPHSLEGTGAGAFISSLSGLLPGQVVFMRAYATSSVGTAFGNLLQFTTPGLSYCGITNIFDVDGNLYHTVQIGNQCWMKENLKATHYADGTAIPYVSASTAWAALTYTSKAYCKYNALETNYSVYGGLYTWAAAMNGAASSQNNPSGVQGACPSGWHLPSDAEWKQLELFLGMSQSQADSTGFRGTDQGNQIKEAGTDHWYVASSGVSNSSGFTAFASGMRSATGSFSSLKSEGMWWTSTAPDSSNAWYRYLAGNNQKVSRVNYFKDYGFAVRCLRDTAPTTFLPQVETLPVSNVLQHQAQCGGDLTFDGGLPILDRGICWNLAGTPTTSDAHISQALITGPLTSPITGLANNTTFHIRAYATNVLGTVYGQEFQFSTGVACPGQDSLTDVDGNAYSTVLIGNQCWMRENLKTLHQPSGQAIPLVTTASAWYALSYSSQAACYYNDNAVNGLTYGLLYTWPAAMAGGSSSASNPSGLQGICPTGWHLPSDNEWKQMEMFLGMSQSQADTILYRGTTEGGKLKETGFQHWASPNTGATNSAGFFGLPGGLRGHNGTFGGNTLFWTSTMSTTNYSWVRGLYTTYSQISRSATDVRTGLSVRCVSDSVPAIVLPSVQTTPVSTSTPASFVAGGEVASDGGSSLLGRGLCWNTTGNPSLLDSTTIQGAAIGSFSTTLSGLTTNVEIYFRAYATNSLGTAYGEVLTFTPLSPCPGTPTITDIDGITYPTVLIGTQCWMKENLRVTRYADGNELPEVPAVTDWNNLSIYQKARCLFSNAPGNNATYGQLYNWAGAMNGASGTGTDSLVVQGICPIGWHLPSDLEWKTLEIELGMIPSVADSSGWRGTTEGGKMKETGTSHWTTPNTGASNLSGLVARPGGFRSNNGNFYDLGISGVLWSATTGDSLNAWYRGLNNEHADVQRPMWFKDYGFSVRCIKDTVLTGQLPVILTSSAYSITQTTAISGGNITAEGGSPVTARGLCWNNTGLPTLADAHSSDGSGTGGFATSLGGLLPHTVYYLRAYATNSQGTAYGSEVGFITDVYILPTVSTSAVGPSGSLTVTTGGEVLTGGNTPVTARGVCWNTTGSPTLADSFTTDGTGVGSFSTTIPTLLPNFTYYFRAYATNTGGTTYGSQVFCNTAPFCPGTPTVMDVDSNVYNTVQIGTQCWMRENMKATHYADGTSLTYIPYSSWFLQDTLVKGFTFYDNSVQQYGVHYNWRGATNGPPGTAPLAGPVQGLCPTGWHVPTDDEWKSLEVFLGMTQAQADSNGYRGSTEASALKEATTLHWGFGNPDGHNSSGFTALASGRVNASNIFVEQGSHAYYWASTVNGPYAYMRHIAYNSTKIERNYWDRKNSYNLRCVKGSSLPSAQASGFFTLSNTSGRIQGTIITNGGDAVTVRGFCWNTTGSPDLTDLHTVNTGTSTTWTDTLTGLTSGTTYYVRAYATNGIGTSYSDVATVQFVAPCPGMAVATDVDGNVYETIPIGTQCWMRSNLKTKHFADGVAIPVVVGASNWTLLSTTDFARCAYLDDTTKVATYGWLYNWATAIYGFNGSSANPSGLQGVCPNGWHLPSDNEWKQMEMFLGMTQAQADGTSYRGTDEGGKLKESGYGHWISPNSGATNSSGFTGLPGAFRHSSGTFYGDVATFWTATESSTVNAWGRGLYYNYSQVGRGFNSKNYGFSIRCVLNN